MYEFKLPSLGADMDEGTLLRWNVAPGQAVKKGDIIAVVDTTKAAVDVEIWVDGTVHRLVTEVGEKIPVGTVMALLLEAGEEAPADEGNIAAPEAPAAATARQRVSPAARRRAAELGVPLAGIAGTGADAAVTLEDVERAAAAAAAPAAAPAGTPAGAPAPTDRSAEMRRAIAAAMSRSKREIPHYYLAEPVPMRRALDWLRAANEQRPVTARLLPAVLLLKAVALAVRGFPEMNGVHVDGVFRPSEAVHLGVAISLRQGGLIAPALHDAGTRTLDELMRDLTDLVKRARAGSLRSSEMSDPTLTVTNLGDQGVDAVVGVIYPPQVALVGFGRIGERPWVEDGRVIAMPALTASLSADHRVSDGHRGALFLARLRDLLQQPESL
ncbi:pyruvate dehydrogenase E2 component (dihydrolipoamide acetyltransferase) [Burkholderiaceae bacterium]|nr:pyruvate dehydrogenase E2 component (dihydrolipoamide acetyltransferase) [Burkholderiaceae bacterium]